MAVINKPLTNLQLELLQLYSMNLPDEALLDIKRIIARYFADKASNEMDSIWDEQGWSDERMDQWLKDNSEDKGQTTLPNTF